MARPRIYRHQARCPECGSNWMLKDGRSKGRQVYHCGDCGAATFPKPLIIVPAPPIRSALWRCTGKAAR